MNTTQLPAGSTRLGNIAFSPAGVSLEIEGQPVWIRKENDGPSIAALQSFHRAALGDYKARQRPPARPGWIARLRSWIGRLLNRPEPVGGEPGMEHRGPPNGCPGPGARAQARDARPLPPARSRRFPFPSRRPATLPPRMSPFFVPHLQIRAASI